MAEHILERELTIKLPLGRLFDFFADAENLEKITPPEMDFRILTPRPIIMEKGTLIDYQLGLYGIPLKWRTEISVWNPPYEFVDTQLSGPYSQWIHHHRFTEISSNETLIGDKVRYRLPLAPIGDLGHFFVRRQLEYIFDFRQQTVEEVLAKPLATVHKVGSASQ